MNPKASQYPCPALHRLCTLHSKIEGGKVAWFLGKQFTVCFLMTKVFKLLILRKRCYMETPVHSGKETQTISLRLFLKRTHTPTQFAIFFHALKHLFSSLKMMQKTQSWKETNKKWRNYGKERFLSINKKTVEGGINLRC